MFRKPLSSASTLDRAIAASVAAMLAMNLFVLVQQLQPAPALAAADGAPSAQQA
jgi:hypothetical protein